MGPQVSSWSCGHLHQPSSHRRLGAELHCDRIHWWQSMSKCPCRACVGGRMGCSAGLPFYPNVAEQQRALFYPNVALPLTSR